MARGKSEKPSAKKPIDLYKSQSLSSKPSDILLQPVEISIDIPNKTQKKSSGLKINRRYTTPGEDVYKTVEWEKRSSIITDEKGNLISQINDISVPKFWTQLATDILAYKYLRKAGLQTKEGRETGADQAVYRIAHTMADFGEKFGYFATKEDRQTYEDELVHLLLNQKAAFNSPVWFNCGLYHQYNIEGPGGSFYWDFNENKVLESRTAYRNPQCSACFILKIEDTLGGIYDSLKTESRIFKYGSGSGANFSKLRSKYERLSGGGTSSGMMSFLRVFDRGADSVKSGGTTRRAAKMVVVNISHPEIEDFINWKVNEEKKAQALIAAGYPSDFNGEAYHTVSGQNSNNSVRLSDEFMTAYENDGEWQTRMVTTGEPHKTYKARGLMDQIASAAWRCADPGVQFDTTINEWHTCPNTDRINASNPCVTGDTLIATTQGLKRIENLVDKDVTIIGTNGNYLPVSKIWKTGHKPIYKLETKSGYIVHLTEDHKVYTLNRGDVAANNLTKDDIIELQGSGFGVDTLPTKIAELVGLMVGDGCVTSMRNDERYAMLAFNSNEQLIAESVVSAVNTYTAHAVASGTVDKRSSRPTRIMNTPTGLRVGSGSKPILQVLEKYAILDQKSAGKKFTDNVFNLDKNSVAAIIRGLLSADGTVANYSDKSQYISLDSTSTELIHQVQLLLLNFGIKAKVYNNRRPVNQTKSLLPDGKGGYKEYPVKQVFSLRISKTSRVKYEKFINFFPSSAKAQELSRINKISAYSEPLTDKIKQVAPTGRLADVYDLTEPLNHHFTANGVVVHNCSEYMFLDSSACNLASVNLVKFIKEDGSFDIAGYRHACRIMLISQEIAVDLSSYPVEEIAKNSHDYRPLGLGYANLGALLMLMGIPYDSPKGTAICGAITAIMTGHAYKTSAELAAVKGPFAGFVKNRAPMLNVIKKHRTAAYRIDEKYCPTTLLEAAHQDWDEAVALGEQFGYRNAQTTLLAPTGTIGLLMDCDTTGIEPDFALVKFKKLAGGGSMKIINNSVGKALENLGYSKDQQNEIISYAVGTGTLNSGAPVNKDDLIKKGLTLEEIIKIEVALPASYDITHVFNRYIIGDELFTRLGIDKTQSGDPSFSLLKKLGYTNAQIEQSNEIICGTQMLEGAPGLKNEHYAVFDCAGKCGTKGTRFIEPMGHVRIMAAAQPFLSGAISKTVNMPNDATVEEVKDIYIQSWKLGLKALALYRDGSKMSQPLNAKREEVDKSEEAEEEKVKIIYETRRRFLPNDRNSLTHKFSIAGHKGYFTVGMYPDGQAGEIFVTMAKQGSLISGLMDSWATTISISLQYGVPLYVLVKKMLNSHYEPYGFTTNPQIRIAKSLADYMGRYLAIHFLNPSELDELGIKSDKNIAVKQTALDLDDSTADDAKKVTGPVDGIQANENKSPVESTLNPQTDSPPCPNCGSMTVKSGTCYTCMSCGSTTGGCS